jgi:outer membrane biosynthesis protein TonB
MALGGIAVAAAVVCVIEFGPWKGAKADSARQQTVASVPVPVQPPATAPATPAPPQEAAPQPAPAPKPDATAKPAARPRDTRPTPPQPAQPQLPAPQPEAQQPAPQPPPAQPPATEPAPAAPKQPSRQELMRAREFMAKLHFRSDAVNSILQNLQRRQEASGMGLNARFTRPQGLMNTYLENADQAINEGDLRAAHEYAEKAERQIEILEKLLNM